MRRLLTAFVVPIFGLFLLIGCKEVKPTSVPEEESVDSVMEEEAIPFQLADEGHGVAADVPIRENFANTIAWEPFLRSDKDGNISFSFTNSC